ncbi:hypothetical protein V8G54_019781, partial [Vigna mungo]
LQDFHRRDSHYRITFYDLICSHYSLFHRIYQLHPHFGTVAMIQSLNFLFPPNTRLKLHFSKNNLLIFHSITNPFIFWSTIENLGFSRCVPSLLSFLAKVFYRIQLSSRC